MNQYHSIIPTCVYINSVGAYQMYFIWQWVSVLSVPGLLLVFYSWWWLLLLLPVVYFRWYHVELRAGASGPAPSDRAGIVRAWRPGMTVVGQGWHYYLQRKSAGRVLFTYNFTGRYVHNGVEYWASGTLIGTIARYYRDRGLAFWSMPSYENISLGAWLVDINHGSQGDLGKPSSYSFDMVDYVDGMGVVRQDRFKETGSLGCVLGVSFSGLSKNIDLEKEALFATEDMTLEDVRAWLAPSVQRVLFIGKRAIGVVWRYPGGAPHRDPHCCSRFCLWFQIDPWNVCCRCALESRERFHSLVSLYHVNRFVPYIFPVMTLFACFHLNYEVIVDMQGFDPSETIMSLYRGVRDLSGRFEIRFGRRYLFLDVSMTRDLELPLEVLRGLGFTRYALHRGKYQVSYEGMERIPVSRMF